MHTTATTELPDLATLALITLCPLPIAEGLKTILPYIPETIAVDVALGKVCSYGGTARDIAIYAD